ncbi:unnamed protein product [Moneuplotes crassus]|uniref:EF-hand domain-containing protein n=1 Tax=Euplotes crassus TaxID=5936 RepID=A0AAD1XAM3_EUPCR|nr:unnamed protein product [Moneuplotes crassus]
MINSKLVAFLENKISEKKQQKKPGEKYKIKLNARRGYMPKIGSKIYENKLAISRLMAQKKSSNFSQTRDFDNSFTSDDYSPYSLKRRSRVINRRFTSNFLPKESSTRSQLRSYGKMNTTGMNYMPYTNTKSSLNTTWNRESNFKKYFSKPTISSTKGFTHTNSEKFISRTIYGGNLMKSHSKKFKPAVYQDNKSMPKKNSLNYREIKRLREEFNLERNEVYTLNSEYDSMLYMQDNKTSKGGLDPGGSKNSFFDFGGEQEEKGITCQFFFDNATFIKGILPEIMKRIVIALGLDADSPITTLSKEHYLKLYCMLEKSTYKDDGVKFWCTFFDPHGFGTVPEKDYMSLLEKMVRGKSYDFSNHFTQLYAEKIQKIFEETGCLLPENELVISKFKKCLQNERVPNALENPDIPVIKEIWFSSALGNRELILDD